MQGISIGHFYLRDLISLLYILSLNKHTYVLHTTELLLGLYSSLRFNIRTLPLYVRFYIGHTTHVADQ